MNVLKNIKWIVITECMYSVTSVFINTFIIAYIFEISNQSAVEVGLYYVYRSLAIAVLAFVSGYYIKTHYKMNMYRIAPILNIIFFVLVYILGKDVKYYTGYLGFMGGMIVTLRCLPRNLLVSNLIAKESMIKYQGYVSAVKGLTNVSIPFLLGLFLTFDSYEKTMIVLSLLLLLELLFTFNIKETGENLSIRYNPYRYIKMLTKNKEIIFACLMETFKGLALEGITPVVIKLYIVYLFVTPFNLGSLTSLFAFVTIAANFIFGKFCQYKYFSKILLSFTTLTIFASSFFVIYPNSASFLFYNFCFVSVAQILLIITIVNIFNVSNIQKIKGVYKTEYFAIREVFLNAGRILGAIVLVVISYFQNFEILRYFLLFLTMCMGVMGWCAIKLSSYLEKRS